MPCGNLPRPAGCAARARRPSLAAAAAGSGAGAGRSRSTPGQDGRRLAPAKALLRHGVRRSRLRVRAGGAAPSGVRRRLLAALADSGDLADACRAAGVSRGMVLAMLADDAAFQTSWDGLAGARLLWLDWALADRALAALQRVPGEESAALPDKAALALAQWLVDQRGRPRARGSNGAARATPQAPDVPMRAAPAAPPGDGDAQEAAEVAALIETVRARIEAAEAAIDGSGAGGA